MAVRSKEMVCNRYTAGIAGSNPAGGNECSSLEYFGSFVGSGVCDIGSLVQRNPTLCVCVCVI